MENKHNGKSTTTGLPGDDTHNSMYNSIEDTGGNGKDLPGTRIIERPEIETPEIKKTDIDEIPPANDDAEVEKTDIDEVPDTGIDEVPDQGDDSATT